jgi:hypothetical protein
VSASRCRVGPLAHQPVARAGPGHDPTHQPPVVHGKGRVGRLGIRPSLPAGAADLGHQLPKKRKTRLSSRNRLTGDTSARLLGGGRQVIPERRANGSQRPILPAPLPDLNRDGVRPGHFDRSRAGCPQTDGSGPLTRTAEDPRNVLSDGPDHSGARPPSQLPPPVPLVNPPRLGLGRTSPAELS